MSLKLQNVTFAYAKGTPHETKAIDDISLEIDDGDFIGIMGRTGCGKSTLIQLIDGLLKPDEGFVYLNGEDINNPDYDRNILRKSIGMVFQFPEYQLFETTVRKDVAFGLKHHGLPPEQVELQVREALETMGFDYERVKDISPLTFSGGEKRRIAIAGILAVRPDVLILDEPIAGLDPSGREAFLNLLDEINSRGTTIIMISHNADAISEHAKKILILKDGKLAAEGAAADILSDTELLKKNNIGLCQVRQLALLLQEKGLNIPGKLIHYDELTEYLVSYLKGV